MSLAPRKTHAEMTEPGTPGAADASRAWFDLFLRTIKICRTYNPGNLTVPRIRARLAAELREILSRQESLRFCVTSKGPTTIDGQPLAASDSEPDIGFLLYRDGIRAIGFRRGIARDELDRFLDLLLARSAAGLEEDDLQIALWKMAPERIDCLAVPIESELEEEEEEGAAAETNWPDAGREEETREAEAIEEALATGDQRLPEAADSDAEELVRAIRARCSASIYERATGIVERCLSQCATDQERRDFLPILQRLSRHAMAQGDWSEAASALEAMRRHAAFAETAEDPALRLLSVASILRVHERLDGSDPAGIAEFIRFARSTGDAAVDWLVFAVGECQQRRSRRILADALVPLCKDRPERLTGWIGDPRWYLVRNIVYVLGAIGGAGTVGLLEPLLHHPDRRVRREVATALSHAAAQEARPLLLQMLGDCDSGVLTAVLDRLAGTADPALARKLLERIHEPDFAEQPPELRLAICRTAGSAGGETILPALEAELARGGWIASSRFTHSDAIALCIAGVGTKAAKEVLERSARSARASIRQAARSALDGVAR